MKQPYYLQRFPACLTGWVLFFCLRIAAQGASPTREWPPRVWTAFGPALQEHMAERGFPDAGKLAEPSALRQIPETLTFGGEEFPGQRVAFTGNQLDLGLLFGGAVRGKTVHLLAHVVAEEELVLPLGASADWFMQWWLNGEPLYDTLSTGNRSAAFEIDDHVFDVPLRAGTNILAVAVVGGSSSFRLMIGDPAARKADPDGHEAALRAGRRLYESRDGLRLDPPIDFAAARRHFKTALEAATSDAQRAAALLAIGKNRLHDFRVTDQAATRAYFEQVLALPEIGSGAGRIKARAGRGLVETALRENRYAAAREALAAAEAASNHRWDLEDAQLLRARILFQERRYEEAEQAFERLLAMEPRREALPWEARALRTAARLAPTIRPDHPRIFFNADQWPEIEARALTRERERLDSLRTRIESQPVTRLLRTHEPMQRIMEAAFLWRVTRDEALLEKTRELLAEAGPELFFGTDAGGRRRYNRGYPFVAWITALDWVWNDLPENERVERAEMLLNAAEKIIIEERIRERLHRTAGHTLSYYLKTMLYYAGLVLVSPDLSWNDADYARVLAVLGHGHAIQFTEVENALRLAGEDGAFRTDVNYYFGETLSPYWPLLYCFRSAFDREPPAHWANFLSPDFVMRSIIGFGGRLQGRTVGMLYFGQGHSWRSPGGMRADVMVDNMAQYIHFFSVSRPDHAALAHVMLDRLRAAGAGGTGAYTIYPFLRDEPEPGQGRLPGGLPRGRHFPRVQQILMSSGFGTEDTFVLYRPGGGGSSIDFDTTHFTIYRQGYLALDSGTRAQTRHPSMPPGPCANMNYARQTVAHNAVLIHMPEENFPGIESNSGGQRHGPDRAELLAFHSAPHYVYAATDATGTYHEDKCAQMVRQFLFLPPDHVVVLDRVTATRAEYPKAWLLHTSNEPHIRGLEFHADQDEGRIFCRTLLPRDARLEPIGGPGREFWADGRNWPVDPTSPWAPRGFDPENIPEEWGRWRVEVQPGAARETDSFLHVLQTAGQEVEHMSPTQLETAGDLITLRFEHHGMAYRVTFAGQGDIGGHIHITRDGRVLADEPLPDTVMPQSGLALQER